MKTKWTNELYFTPEQIEKIDRLAKRRGRKRAQVVMDMVIRALEKTK